MAKRTFEEVTNPESVKFEKIGSVIEGEILLIKDVIIKGDSRKVAVLLTEEGKKSLWISSGLTQILDLPCGAYIRITYTEDKDTGQVQPCKLFKIEVDPSTIVEPF